MREVRHTRVTSLGMETGDTPGITHTDEFTSLIRASSQPEGGKKKC